MKRYTTSQPATYGLYVSARPVDIRFVGADGEPLEGKDGASYRRLPMWAVVLLGPALGGAFVLAFPLLVVAAVLATATSAAFRAATASRHAYVAHTPWQPAASYFDARTDAPKDAPTADPAAAELAALEAEVARRAQDEKHSL